jgi:hypothetical protein
VGAAFVNELLELKIVKLLSEGREFLTNAPLFRVLKEGVEDHQPMMSLHRASNWRWGMVFVNRSAFSTAVPIFLTVAAPEHI